MSTSRVTPRRSTSRGSSNSRTAISPTHSSPQPAVVRHKSDWDTSLANPDRFKLSPEEMLAKKQALISKHNALLKYGSNSDVQTPTSGTRSKQQNSVTRKKKEAKKEALRSAYAAFKHHELSVLDLLDTPAPENRPQSASNRSDATTADIATPYKDNDLDSSDSDDSGERLLYNPQKLFPAATPNSVSPKNEKLHATYHNRVPLYKPGNRISRSQPAQSLTAELYREAGSDAELAEIMREIQSLESELRNYEELTGKRSALHSEDVLTGHSLSAQSTVRVVLKSVVHLASASLSHLLSSELAMSKSQTMCAQLTERLDSATAAIQNLKDSNALIEKKLADMIVLGQTKEPVSIQGKETAKRNEDLLSGTHRATPLRTSEINDVAFKSPKPTTGSDWLLEAASSSLERGPPSTESSATASPSNMRHTMDPFSYTDRPSTPVSPRPSNFIKMSDLSTPQSSVSIPSAKESQADLDEETLKLYQYLCKTKTKTRASVETSKKSSARESVFGPNSPVKTPQTDNSSTSEIPTKLFSTVDGSTKVNNIVSTNKDESFGSDRDGVFDALVRRLTAPTPIAKASPAMAEQASMVARQHLPSPALAPKHPFLASK